MGKSEKDGKRKQESSMIGLLPEKQLIALILEDEMAVTNSSTHPSS